MDVWDMACTKIAVAFFVLFLLSVWPAFNNLIQSTSPWFLFFGWLIFAIRPLSSFFKKR
ncbi:MAG: hypothetical protein WCX20_01225 [Candidatus Shapirobacteria bacterium]|jgi:hypothetical protein